MTEDLQCNQIPIDFEFYTKKTLDNFIVGDNHDLYHSLLDLQESDSIIFIYGGKSSGKTHLCEAATHLMERRNTIKIKHDDDLESILFLDFYDLVVIDDMDKLLSNPANEELIFTIVNNQILNKKSTLITSTKELGISDFHLNDLHSRIFSDKIYSISDLNDEDKINLMISKSTDIN